MRTGVKISVAAMIVLMALASSASAQTSAQAPSGSDGWVVAPGGVSGSFYEKAGAAPGAPNTPAQLSDGTLAESANTTALASDTYHQPSGFLPGMKP